MRRTACTAGSLRIVLCTAIVVACIALSHHRNGTYHSKLSLWLDVVVKNPGRARARNNLANAYFLLGRTADAVIEYRKALELDRYFVRAYYNLGMALEEMNRPDEAVYYYGVYCRDAPSNFLKPVACERYRVLMGSLKKAARR